MRLSWKPTYPDQTFHNGKRLEHSREKLNDIKTSMTIQQSPERASPVKHKILRKLKGTLGTESTKELLNNKKQKMKKVVRERETSQESFDQLRSSFY